MSGPSPLDRRPGEPHDGPHDGPRATPWRQLPGWRPVTSGLWLIGIAIVVTALASGARRILWTSVFEALASPDPDIDHDAIFERLELYSRLFPVFLIAAGSALAVGLHRIAQAPMGRGVRMFGWLACAAVCLNTLEETLLWLEVMLEYNAISAFLFQQPIQLVSLAVHATGLACWLLALVRISAAVAAPVPKYVFVTAVAWIAWTVALPLLMTVIESARPIRQDSPWLYTLVSTGIWLFGEAVFLYLTVRLSRALGRPTRVAADTMHEVEDGAVDALGPGWSGPADGLRLYASGLAWRIALTVGGYVVLLFAVLGRSVPLTKFVVFVMPVAALITSLVMLSGMARYARQPDDGGASGAAWLAWLLMGCGVLLEAYGLILVLQMLSLDASDWDAIRELRRITENAEAVSRWAMGLGFGSLLAVLISFGQLSHRPGLEKLSGRVVVTGVFLSLVSIAVLAFRTIGPETRMDQGALVGIALAVLLAAVIAIVSYLNLVNAVADAVHRDSGHSTDLPSAKVV